MREKEILRVRKRGRDRKRRNREKKVPALKLILRPIQPSCRKSSDPHRATSIDGTEEKRKSHKQVVSLNYPNEQADNQDQLQVVSLIIKRINSEEEESCLI